MGVSNASPAFHLTLTQGKTYWGPIRAQYCYDVTFSARSLAVAYDVTRLAFSTLWAVYIYCIGRE